MSVSPIWDKKNLEQYVSNVRRYIQNTNERITDEEMGKALVVLYQLHEREAERDAREYMNKLQGELNETA